MNSLIIVTDPVAFWTIGLIALALFGLLMFLTNGTAMVARKDVVAHAAPTAFRPPPKEEDLVPYRLSDEEWEYMVEDIERMYRQVRQYVVEGGFIIATHDALRLCSWLNSVKEHYILDMEARRWLTTVHAEAQSVIRR